MDSMTALHVAVLSNDVYEFRKILQKHEDINTVDTFGNTPLHYASMKRNINLMEALINNGAKINVQNNNGRTPLMVTMLNKDCVAQTKKRIKNEVYMAMEFLLNKGANPNLVDVRGDTVLHQVVRKVAHRSVKKNCADLLIRSPTDVEIINKQGKTAYDEAVDWRISKLILMFNLIVPRDILLGSKEIIKAKESKEKEMKENKKNKENEINKVNENTNKNNDIIQLLKFEHNIKITNEEDKLITAAKMRNEIEAKVHSELQKVLAKSGA